MTDQPQISTAVMMAKAFAQQTTTPSEQLERVLAKHHIAPHAFISFTETRAREQAEQATKRWQSGYPLSIFDGVPIAYKDLFDIKDTVTTAGSPTRQNAPVAQYDAAQVSQLSRMGLVGVGKTNLTEYAYSGLGLNPHFGTPPNVIDDHFIAGGSSSGSATVVGSGLLPLAMGTDTAGSIRIPSAFNGLVGHRATHQRYDMTGVFPLASSLDTTGAIAHTAQDCYIIDQLLCNQPLLSDLDLFFNNIQLPIEIERIYPTFYTDPSLLAYCDDDVAHNFIAFVEKLHHLGFKVIEHRFHAIKKTLALINQGQWLGAAEAYALHEDLLHSEQAHLMDKRVYQRLLSAKNISASTQIRLYQAQKDYQKQIAAELGNQLLLLPTVAHIAPRLQPLEQDPEWFREINLKTLRLTMIGSFLNWAIVTMPTGVGQFGLPTSASIAGLAHSDREVLQTAYKLEYYLI